MNDKIESAAALAARARFLYLSSLDPAGDPETRVLFNLRRHRAKALTQGAAALGGPFENSLGTNRSSEKAAQVLARPRVCLYYSDNLKFEGLTLKGRLEEVTDRAVIAAVYAKSWDMYYPGGMDGGDFILFRFYPESAKYYHGLSTCRFDPQALRLIGQ
jgi:hypothetical protein